MSTDQRELIARLVGPLEVRGISRSVFRDVLADAEITVLTKMMFEWKSERQRTGDLKGLLASIDLTFTGHHTDRRVTYAPAGGAQPKSGAAIAQFTNCIVTVVWSDGVNRTPPVLFTFNGKFRLDRVGRKAWAQDSDS